MSNKHCVLLLSIRIGIEGKGTGDALPQSTNQWGKSPRNLDIPCLFSCHVAFLCIFQHFDKSGTKIQGVQVINRTKTSGYWLDTEQKQQK